MLGSTPNAIKWLALTVLLPALLGLPPVAVAANDKVTCPDGSKANDPKNCPQQPQGPVATFSSSGGGVQPWQEYAKAIRAAEVVKGESSTVFGDSVSLYTGAVEFSATDISLPGNNSLAVSLGRSYSAATGPRHFPFADWDMDVPYISGEFFRSAGWVVATGSPQNRCSSPTSPETAAPTYIPPPDPGWESFSGYHFFSAASGKQEVLFATNSANPKPTDGKTYAWVTNQHWHFSCLPALKNGQPGEGFVAHAPDGTRYYLDWMVKRPANDILYPVILNNGMTGGEVIYRDEIRLYATRVEDRFGNWVDYTWSGDQLTRIQSNDGRIITILWATGASGHAYISKASTNTTPVREWNYSYEYASGSGGFLKTVMLPDSSTWAIDFKALWGLPYYDGTLEYVDYGNGYGEWIPVQDKAVACSWMQVLSPVTQTGTIKHPSGAQGTFAFRFVRHDRTGVANDCVVPPYVGDTFPDYLPSEHTNTRYRPVRFDVLALQSKQIQGPGVTSGLWSYSYNVTTTATTKSHAVTGPNNAITKYFFGIEYGVNEGQLLKTETYEASTLLHKTENKYISNLDAPSQLFVDQVGTSANPRSLSFSAERLRPSISSVTTQQGRAFNWNVSKTCGTSSVQWCFDPFARPTKVVKSSAPSP